MAEDDAAMIEDTELLTYVLEMGETIEEVKNENELEPLKAQNEARIEESVGNLERAFEDNDVEMAKKEAVKLRYWINIKDSLQSWEEDEPVILVH